MFPLTEPTTCSSRTIWYRSGAGPVVGPDQWNATELVVEKTAVSPAGRKTGAEVFARAVIIRPAVAPSTTTAAIPATARCRHQLFLAAVRGVVSAALGVGRTISAACCFAG